MYAVVGHTDGGTPSQQGQETRALHEHPHATLGRDRLPAKPVEDGPCPQLHLMLEMIHPVCTSQRSD